MRWRSGAQTSVPGCGRWPRRVRGFLPRTAGFITGDMVGDGWRQARDHCRAGEGPIIAGVQYLSQEVEEVIDALPGVERAVIGIPHP